MKRLLLFRISLSALLCCSVPAFGQTDTVRVSNERPVAEINNRQIEFYIDERMILAFDSVRKHFCNGHYFTSSERIPNLTGNTGRIWFRIFISNKTSESLYVSFQNLYLEKISLFTKTKDHWEVVTTGYLLPFQQRDLEVTRYNLRLPISNSGEPQVIYGSIDVKSQPPLYLNLHIGTLKSISALNRKFEFISIAALGIMLMMLFYNLCLFSIVDDRLLLFYCIYIIGSIVCVLWLSGHLFEWFWPNHPELNPYPWQNGFFYFTQILFVNKILRAREEFPKLFLLSAILNALCLVIIGVNPFVSAKIIALLIMLVGMLMPVYFLSVSLQLAWRRRKIAFAFLLGGLPILTVTPLNILMMRNVIEYNMLFDIHGIEVCLVWEIVMFSLVLGYRFNLIRKEKVAVQSENLRITSEQKILLRKMVFEQTEEIVAQNEQLLRNQEEIKLQNERLENQNKAYERLKELILRQNQELESSVQRRTLQLAQSNEALKKHLHQVEQFSFIAAHNLRAPVARIIGLASIFERSSISNTENLSILDKLVSSAKDLDVIIHDLGAILDTQKKENEKTETIDVRILLDKILNRYEPEAGKIGIQVNIDARAVSVAAIPAYMDSILSNLISNSIKYRTEQRTPVISISTETLNGHWKITVEDNGLGFDSDLVSQKLFEPFQRFHTHKDGKGLGMFLVKTQVEAMQGSINVISKINKGTKVEIQLPQGNLQMTA